MLRTDLTVGHYQYWLDRSWAELGTQERRIVFVMLNPSIGDSEFDDPTIRRCVGFARREGFSGLRLVNLYAFQTAYPAELRKATDPVGPQNDAHLEDALQQQRANGLPVVAAWGTSTRRADLARVAQVLGLVPGTDWRCLGLTSAGAPRHPLYVRRDQPLLEFVGETATFKRAGS